MGLVIDPGQTYWIKPFSQDGAPEFKCTQLTAGQRARGLQLGAGEAKDLAEIASQLFEFARVVASCVVDWRNMPASFEADKAADVMLDSFTDEQLAEIFYAMLNAGRVTGDDAKKSE